MRPIFADHPLTENEIVDLAGVPRRRRRRRQRRRPTGLAAGCAGRACRPDRWHGHRTGRSECASDTYLETLRSTSMSRSGSKRPSTRVPGSWEEFYRNRFQHDKRRPHHARRQLHGQLLVGGVRQGRHRHVGAAGHRLPAARRGPAAVRATRLPARHLATRWYLYSPLRVKYPYVRGALVDMYRSAKEEYLGDPVEAWAASRRTPSGASATRKPAARADSGASAGTRRSRSLPPR